MWVENTNQVASILDGSDDNDKVDPVIDDGLGKHRERSICHVSFSNKDLGNLVNGWPNNRVELQLFDCHLNPKWIIKSWIAVEFMSMMGNRANDWKVSYKLGEGGAPQEASD